VEDGRGNGDGNNDDVQVRVKTTLEKKGGLETGI